jgi:hypothetical protein
MILTGQGILKSEEGLNSSLYVWLKEENTHCSRPPPSPSPFFTAQCSFSQSMQLLS